MKTLSNNGLAAALLAAGVALGGWFVGEGFVQGRTADRFVSVKGLSEREVQADIALWPIRFVVTDDELTRAQAGVKRSERAVMGFLRRFGLQDGDTEVHRLTVNDRLANPYRSGPIESRFVITETLMVRTNQPELVKEASQHIGDLVDAGVVLAGEGGPHAGPAYLFTRVTELKPGMIAEATANARRAAEQFAADAASRLGGIRRASQGVFVIRPRDRAPGITEQSQLHKSVRVVSTIEYYLEER